MANISILLTILIGISGVAAIYGRFSSGRSIQRIFRPLTLLLIYLLGFHGSDLSEFADVLILAGLVAMVIGDLLFLFSTKRNALAFGLFGFAILLFTMACMEMPGPYFLWGAFLPVFLVAIAMLLLVMRKLKQHFIPAIVLIILLSTFIMQAAGRAWYIAEDGTGLMFAGAICLAVSASILLFEQVGKKVRLAPIFYLALCWSALTFIALSTY